MVGPSQSDHTRFGHRQRCRYSYTWLGRQPEHDDTTKKKINRYFILGRIRSLAIAVAIAAFVVSFLFIVPTIGPRSTGVALSYSAFFGLSIDTGGFFFALFLAALTVGAIASFLMKKTLNSAKNNAEESQ